MFVGLYSCIANYRITTQNLEAEEIDEVRQFLSLIYMHQIIQVKNNSSWKYILVHLHISVLVFDTLHYGDIVEAKKLSTSTKKLLKLLCNSTSVKIRYMNVCPQEENGKLRQHL